MCCALLPLTFVRPSLTSSQSFGSETISKNWTLPRLYAKSKPPPWIALVTDFGVNRAPLDIEVTCITSYHLTGGVDLHLMKHELDYHPGLALDPCSKLRDGFHVFRTRVASFKQSQILLDPSRNHSIKACWAKDEPCIHGRKRHHFSTARTNLRPKVSGCHRNLT